jgi:uncharacterized protein
LFHTGGDCKLRWMKSSVAWPVIGVAFAIAITTMMDLGGLANFSALALFPLTILFWVLERHPRADMGLAWGRVAHYGLAVVYPAVVLTALALIAVAADAVDLTEVNWAKAWRNFALIGLSTFIGAILTEEGFFRGWLWASLSRAGQGPTRVLLWSSIAFALWHISAVTIAPDFSLPAAQIPVYLVNAAAIGLTWGLLRAISGSVIVASLSHGVWNGGAYVFFGFGTRAGELAISETAIFGPEVGIIGLGLNIAFAAALWWWFRSTKANSGGLRAFNSAWPPARSNGPASSPEH